MGILTRLFGFLVPERELDVEPTDHPYYPGEIVHSSEDVIQNTDTPALPAADTGDPE